MAGALIAALVSSRQLAGAIPGDDPILSMAAIEKGFLVGTAGGLYASPDGKRWAQVKGFLGRRALVARAADKAVVLHEKNLLATSDLKTYEAIHDFPRGGLALAGDREGNIYVTEDAKHLVLFEAGGSVRRVTATGGPKEILTVAGIPGDPAVILAGGLTSGFWRSPGGDNDWRNILKTPTRAILADGAKQDRIFLGTPGGIFYSNDQGFTWTYSDMRLPVEALAEHQGVYYAITSDRLLYFSKTGTNNWNRLGE
jgi:hypothetical protein